MFNPFFLFIYFYVKELLPETALVLVSRWWKARAWFSFSIIKLDHLNPFLSWLRVVTLSQKEEKTDLNWGPLDLQSDFSTPCPTMLWILKKWCQKSVSCRFDLWVLTKLFMTRTTWTGSPSCWPAYDLLKVAKPAPGCLFLFLFIVQFIYLFCPMGDAWISLVMKEASC